MKILIFLAALSGPCLADDHLIEIAAQTSFNAMPRVERVSDVSTLCGSAGLANRDVIYCSSENTVYLRHGAAFPSYKLAHVMGHAAQVKSGVADVALRTILQNRDQENALRGMVTRQVECIAGFFHARAGVELPDIVQLGREPFTGSHWGRNPMRNGPRVSIGMQARQDWLARGYAAETLADCSVGQMKADLLVAAYTG